MKRIICTLLCAVMLVAVPFGAAGCTPREEILKIYLPGEYMDEDIFKEFKAWFEEETGNKVEVQSETFDTVEKVRLAVENSKADYDLLCPSDYMVEYLINKELILEYDRDIIDVSEDGLFKKAYIDSTREFDTELKYAVPYMYGTLGLVYDITKTNKRITSWEALFGNEFAGRRSIKESMRDAYAVACIYNARTELANGTITIQQVFEDTSAETVRKAGETLKSLRGEGDVWDNDNGKFDMAANKSNVAVALMWSCDAGYVMNDYEDVDENKCEGNRNLWYVVPDEGGNVYIDAFVINKYAKNTLAANYFLKFLCQKEIAIQNSVYAGCISPVAEAYDELYNNYVNDDKMFAGTDAGWKEMFIETMFPSEKILARCGVMKDFGKAGDKAVGDMWSII